jgi:membrane-associated phospholipid phosphatase
MLVTTLLAVAVGMLVPGRTAGRIKDAFQSLGAVWLGGLACGFISLLGLRWQRPLVDAALRRADSAIGLDAGVYAEWVAHQPRGFVMAITGAYNLTTLILFGSMVAVALLGQRTALWQAARCFMGSLLTVCLVFLVVPAKGIGTWVAPVTLSRLPPGAATYFWGSFDQFHGAARPTLSFAAIDGVVSFPSFHMVMGLITLSLWRRWPIAFAVASVWFTLMLMATVPLGGHYAVDLLGGAAIWLGWSLRISRLRMKLSLDLSRWVGRRMLGRPVQPA